MRCRLAESLLSSTVIIRHLLDRTTSDTQASARSATAYLYLSHEDDIELEVLLGSLVRQILSTYHDADNLPERANSILRKNLRSGKYGASGTFSPPCVEDLKHLLCAFAEEKLLYIVLDAMDECKDQTRRDLMKHLRDVQPRLKILVTARLLEGSKDLAQGFTSNRIAAKDADIEAYIDSRLEETSKLKKHGSLIKREVCKKSKEM